LDVGRRSQDAPECLLGPGSGFAIWSQSADIPAQPAWFSGSGVTSRSLNLSQKPKNNLTGQPVARKGEPRYAMAWCMHFREREERLNQCHESHRLKQESVLQGSY
jgi:hypothetical protein